MLESCSFLLILLLLGEKGRNRCAAARDIQGEKGEKGEKGNLKQREGKGGRGGGGDGSALPSGENGNRFKQQLRRTVRKRSRLLHDGGGGIANGDGRRVRRHRFGTAARRGGSGRRLSQKRRRRRLTHVVVPGGDCWLLTVRRKHRRVALMMMLMLMLLLLLLMRGQRSQGRVKVVRVPAFGQRYAGRGDPGWISSSGRWLKQPLHGERAVLRRRSGCGRWQRLRFTR